MIDCTFTLRANGTWKCADCGWIYKRKSDKPPRRNCRPETPGEQGQQQAQALEAGAKLGWKPEHAKHWAAALLRWSAAGCPTRADDEVETIVNICKLCDKYNANEARCSVCGCCISTAGMAVLNKARMATERCPKQKW